MIEEAEGLSFGGEKAAVDSGEGGGRFGDLGGGLVFGAEAGLVDDFESVAAGIEGDVAESGASHVGGFEFEGMASGVCGQAAVGGERSGVAGKVFRANGKGGWSDRGLGIGIGDGRTGSQGEKNEAEGEQFHDAR